MCRWLFDKGANEILDPAFGLGAFYLAARTLNRAVQFQAIEIDGTILAHFREAAPDLDCGRIILRTADYFDLWNISHSAIVCNPPYMRFQHFADRHRVIPELERRLKRKLCGYLNSASAFLLKSLHDLAPGGSLAYLIPLEFLNAGYGEPVKQALLEKGRLKALLRIVPEEEVFPDAVTSVGIILASDDQRSDPVKFVTVRALDELRLSPNDLPGTSIPVAKLDPADKWQRHFESSLGVDRAVFCPISVYGSFSRGIATGANAFFLLSRSRAAKHGLPPSILSPCISRSSQIRQPIITDADIDGLIAEDEPVLLVDLLASQADAVEAYIRFGQDLGFDKRRLTRMRNPWFRLERRSPAPLLVGVFSRKGFKVVRNRSRALSLTCFHGFYPNSVGAEFLDHLFFYLHSPIGQQRLAEESRVYGAGLNKFEPGDLNRILVPSPTWLATIPGHLIREGVAGLNQAASSYRTMFERFLGHPA